jgi:DNA-3-methyladenine glycosylase I
VRRERTCIRGDLSTSEQNSPWISCKTAENIVRQLNCAEGTALPSDRDHRDIALQPIPPHEARETEVKKTHTRLRCEWANSDPLYIRYHDKEWGVPQHDDRTLFEMLVLDGMQAGLSWITILKKRENYRKAFENFDAEKIAEYDGPKVKSLLKDNGIIRNRLKIEAAIQNAKAFLAVQREFGSFDRYIWQFVGGKPRHNTWKTLKQIPANTKESDAMSEDLKRRGFKFVGSTICYAFMQAAGLVNDHLVGCFRYKELKKKRQVNYRLFRRVSPAEGITS